HFVRGRSRWRGLSRPARAQLLWVVAILLLHWPSPIVARPSPISPQAVGRLWNSWKGRPYLASPASTTVRPWTISPCVNRLLPPIGNCIKPSPKPGNLSLPCPSSVLILAL